MNRNALRHLGVACLGGRHKRPRWRQSRDQVLGISALARPGAAEDERKSGHRRFGHVLHVSDIALRRQSKMCRSGRAGGRNSEAYSATSTRAAQYASLLRLTTLANVFGK